MDEQQCPHEAVMVVDELGMMTADQDGYVSAPVLAHHYECHLCGQRVPDPKEPDVHTPHF